ncbi:MAG: hypothetical protein R2838_15045 [Caldilineaceae bacterium]
MPWRCRWIGLLLVPTLVLNVQRYFGRQAHDFRRMGRPFHRGDHRRRTAGRPGPGHRRLRHLVLPASPDGGPDCAQRPALSPLGDHRPPPPAL